MEAASVPGSVAVRDSKNPTGPAPAFGTATWRTFVSVIRDDAMSSVE